MIRQPLLLTIAFLCLSLSGFAQNAQLADTLRNKGETLQDKGNFAQAEFYYKEALNIYDQLQDTTNWLKTSLYYAEILSYRAKNDQAIALFDSLQKINHPVNNLSYKARIQNDLGWLRRRMGNTDQALAHYKNGLDFAEQANDSLLIGILYNNLGQNTSTRESMDFYKKALPYFEGLGNQRSLAVTLANIGRIYEELLLFDKALEYFNRSLDIRKGLDNVNLMASIHQSLGSLQQKRGNYRQALIGLQKSLEYRRKAGDPAQTSSTLNNIGILYSQLGDNQKALAYYREGLALSRDFISPQKLSIAYKNIGSKLWELEKRDEAISFYKRALEIKREVGDPKLLPSSLLDLAKVNISQKNYSEAEQYATEALAIAESTKSYPFLVYANGILASIYRSQSLMDKSLAHYKKAYSYSEFLPAGQRLYPLIDLAYTYHKMASDSALIYGRTAYKIIEKQRVKAGVVSELRSSYFNQYSDFYVELASWTLTYDNNTAEAYKLVEAAKARTLSEELNEASKEISENLPEEIRIKRNNMLNNIDRLYTQLEQTAKDNERAELERKIRNAEFNFEALQNSLQANYSAYKKLEVTEPITLEKAQALNTNDTVILEFAITDNTLLGFLISNNRVSVHQQNLDKPTNNTGMEPDLTALVQNFKDAILAQASREELELHSDKLYQLLLKPFEEELTQYSNLIIVPDGPLAYLPFEALRSNNSYLIEQFDIKYVPSATSYTLLKKPTQKHQKQLLAVAGSGVSDNNLESLSQSSAFSALPSTIIEVDSVSSHFSDSEIIKQENITEQALKKTLNTSYRFVHLATHGVIDEDDPKQSGLVLSTPDELDAASQEDGLLKSSEIYRLNLNSDMVVLSACNSGLGKYVKGEGMLGLQRSFFYAGTSSVVVSLWSVYDRSTAYLMNDFYKAIITAEPEVDSWYTSFMKWSGWDQTIPYGQKASSMRKAKLKLINHPLFNHPVYWAPFIVVGR